MDKIEATLVTADPPLGDEDRKAKVDKWRRENRHLIEAWNEWDAAHPLLTESDLK